MNSKQVFLYGCVLILGACFGGCTASSELGTDDQTISTVVHPDTAAIVPPVVKPTTPAQTNRQGFTTKEDTIEVESAQRTHPSEHKAVTVQARTPAAAAHAGYTVQVGAFKSNANAEHAKALLTRQYKKNVTKQFDESTRLYRVTVGEFSTEQEAWRLAAAIRKKYRKEYGHAWVVRIAE